MYGKVFESIYDGTLAEDWRALITFQQMIVLCDADGTVDMTPLAIARRTGIPIEHIKAGLEILDSPDKFSRTQAEEGRRIMLIDDHRPWGWIIVNHQKYKMLTDSDTVRAQTRERVQRHRDKKRSDEHCNADVTQSNVTVTPCNVTVTPVTHSNAVKRHTDTDTNTDIKKDLVQNHNNKIINSKCFDLFWHHYPRKQGRKKAQALWKRLKLDPDIEKLIADIQNRKTNDSQWQDTEFIPLPTSYLNGNRWEDAIIKAKPDKPKTFNDWEDYGKQTNNLPRPGEGKTEYIRRLQTENQPTQPRRVMTMSDWQYEGRKNGITQHEGETLIDYSKRVQSLLNNSYAQPHINNQ